MFRLDISSGVEEHDGAPFYRGAALIGDFEEEFLAAAVHWSAQRYQRQWREAARRLAEGADLAAFISSFVHPDAVAHLWVGHSDGRQVTFRNLLSLPAIRGALLDPDHPERLLRPRQEASPTEELISEWIIPLADVSAFAAS